MAPFTLPFQCVNLLILGRCGEGGQLRSGSDPVSTLEDQNNSNILTGIDFGNLYGEKIENSIPPLE